MTDSLSIALPEIFLFSAACAILVLDLFLSDARRGMVYALTQLALLGTLLITLQGTAAEPLKAFNGLYVRDFLGDVLKLAILTLSMIVLVYSRAYLRDRAMLRGEYFVLALFAVTGMLVMVSASHFVSLYLGLELLSLSLYAMVAFQRYSKQATEAAMKYFVLGALASGMLLYGMSMLYGVTGSLDIGAVRERIASGGPDNLVLTFGLVFVIVGLAFKLGAVPFHMWIPDVYHGAPTAVTLFLGVAPKLAAFAMFMRLLIAGLPDLADAWRDMLIVMALLSMGVGNVIAIAQTNLKRMLAYSTISHMGFFLLGILSANANGYGSAMFYIMIYATMSAGGFGMIILLSRAGFEAENLDDFKGLNQRQPWYAFLMLIIMFSMAGVPPTAGFFAKFMVIQSVVNADMAWLAVAAVLFSVIGAFYYLRVVKLMYFDAPTDSAPIQASGDMKLMLSINGLALIAFVPWAGALIELCRNAIARLG
jgi:NADH-quinone oxidoreductase subunit N